MNNKIRQEETKDYDIVFNLVEKAFETEELSDHREQFLVERLRQSDSFIPELSLVYEWDGKIVGYILFTTVDIIGSNTTYQALALAPVAVLPDFQSKGIGGTLIEEGHRRARNLGYKSVVLLGHADYYPKFGYVPMKNYNIRLPFDVPDEYCMACELVPNGLKGVEGTVKYSSVFVE